jgi:hypothetical protein
MQKIRKGEASSFSPRRRREDIICELMAKYGATHRMIVRCLDDFLGKIKENENIWSYATEGDGQPLPAQEKEIKKLRPGIYADADIKLRLTVYSTGNRRWSFVFILGTDIREKILGDSELSLATARKLATEASRMLAAGQNPIDGSWSSSVLQSLRSNFLISV